MLEKLRPRGSILVEAILALGHARLGQMALAQTHARSMADAMTKREMDACRPKNTVLVLCELRPAKLIISNDRIRIESGHNNVPSLMKESGFDVVHVWPHQVSMDTLAVVAEAAVAVINCYSEADEDGVWNLADFQGRRLMNSPQAVRRSRRDRISSALAHIDPQVYEVPRTRKWKSRPANLSSGSILARKLNSHSGYGLKLLSSEREIADVQIGEFAYITEYVDTRWSDGLFRKFRAIHARGNTVVEHLLISDHWCVRSASARRFMACDPARQLEELKFIACWRDSHPNIETLMWEIVRATGLDYFIADIGLKPDGHLVLFEANPAGRIILESELAEEGFHLKENVFAVRDMFKRQVIAHGREH